MKWNHISKLPPKEPDSPDISVMLIGYTHNDTMIECWYDFEGEEWSDTDEDGETNILGWIVAPDPIGLLVEYFEE